MQIVHNILVQYEHTAIRHTEHEEKEGEGDIPELSTVSSQHHCPCQRMNTLWQALQCSIYSSEFPTPCPYLVLPFSCSKQRWQGKALSNTSASGRCWVRRGLVTGPRQQAVDPCMPNHIMKHIWSVCHRGWFRVGPEERRDYVITTTPEKREGKLSSKVLAPSSLLFCCCLYRIQQKGKDRCTKES